jgi:hypothetical protein
MVEAGGEDERIPERHDGESDDAYTHRIGDWLTSRFLDSIEGMRTNGMQPTPAALRQMAVEQLTRLWAAPDVIDVRLDPYDPTKIIVTRSVPEQLVHLIFNQTGTPGDASQL